MTDRQELQRHAPRLYRVALRVLGDSHAAEDVVQQVFVRVLEDPDRFAGESAWTTWLHRVTVNCAIDRLRRERSRKERQVDADLRDLPEELGGLMLCPGENAEQRELLAIAKLLLRELTDELRMPFVLTQLDGYSYDEAADTLGVPRGTVASRVARAKLQLLQAGDQIGRGWSETSGNSDKSQARKTFSALQERRVNRE